MKVSVEIKKLIKKYPYLKQYGSAGIFKIIIYHRKRLKFNLFGLLDLILPYKYFWETNVKEKMHKHIPIWRKSEVYKKKDYTKDYLNLYKLLSDNNIKWVQTVLPTGVHMYEKLGKSKEYTVLKTKAYVVHTITMKKFIQKVKDGKFKDKTLIIYTLKLLDNNKIGIRYKAMSEDFIIDFD